MLSLLVGDCDCDWISSGGAGRCRTSVQFADRRNQVGGDSGCDIGAALEVSGAGGGETAEGKLSGLQIVMFFFFLYIFVLFKQVFKAVPYAAPPVGNLRFEAPKKLPPWKGTKLADTFGPVCPQVSTVP